MKKASKTKTTEISWAQCLWVTAGLLLLGGALLVLFHDKNNLVEISTVLEVIMLFSGGVNILIYRKRRDNIHGSR